MVPSTMSYGGERLEVSTPDGLSLMKLEVRLGFWVLTWITENRSTICETWRMIYIAMTPTINFMYTVSLQYEYILYFQFVARRMFSIAMIPTIYVLYSSHKYAHTVKLFIIRRAVKLYDDVMEVFRAEESFREPWAKIHRIIYNYIISYTSISIPCNSFIVSYAHVKYRYCMYIL